MAAPDYVPIKPSDRPRSYGSPPRRGDQWHADRPGDVVGSGAGQPELERTGSPGPDQGYVWKLTHLFEDSVHLTDGELLPDVMAGAVTVALKRASLYGRAPVVHDLRVALTIWGFLDDPADPALVELRTTRFEGAANPHHYQEQRAIADAVPDEALRQTPAQVQAAHAAAWRDLLTV